LYTGLDLSLDTHLSPKCRTTLLCVDFCLLSLYYWPPISGCDHSHGRRSLNGVIVILNLLETAATLRPTSFLHKTKLHRSIISNKENLPPQIHAKWKFGQAAGIHERENESNFSVDGMEFLKTTIAVQRRTKSIPKETNQSYSTIGWRSTSIISYK
jgi:hypothetical protein